jgi:3-polyprenyl-4-hydroxybenzoate decarboxylase
VFFHFCANTDPGRDIVLESRTHGTMGGRIGFDATRKLPGDERHGQPVRDFPPLLRMDEATRALVDRRWHEYGL